MTLHRAQLDLDLARLVAQPGHPLVAALMEVLDRIDAIAERMPGYVRRPRTEAGKATGHAAAGDPRSIPNPSVWRDGLSLAAFVWGTPHRRFHERREEWIEVLGGTHLVMCWVPEGHRPAPEEARDRLAHRRALGDTERAFGWSGLADARLSRDRGCSGRAA